MNAGVDGFGICGLEVDVAVGETEKSPVAPGGTYPVARDAVRDG